MSMGKLMMFHHWMLGYSMFRETCARFFMCAWLLRAVTGQTRIGLYLLARHQPERFAGVPVSSIIYARLAFYIHNVYIICMYLYTYVHIHIFIYIWVCLCVLSLFQASLQRDVRFKYHTQWIKSYNIDCSTHTVGIPPIYCIQFLRLGSWRKCDIVFIAFAGKICILYVSLMHMYIYIHNLVICILKIKDNLYIVPYLKDPCFWS